MRGTEIRTFVAHDDLRLPTDPKNTTDLTLRMHEMRLRWAQLFVQGEIAAQLADLNENINRMVNDQGALDVVVLK